MNLKILIGDPALSGSDYFGIVGLEATTDKIYVRLAKQFNKTPYSIVSKYFHTLHKKHNFDYIILEKNFDYTGISVAFRHLPIRYIHTGSNLTEKTRNKGWSVDKPYMIKWLKSKFKEHIIQYPSIQSKDMAELINQQNQMVGITAPSGHTSYKAMKSRHDDLFLALLIGCNAIRLWWGRTI